MSAVTTDIGRKAGGGQTAGWIRTPLGNEAGPGPGDAVLDWDPAPPMERGTVRLCSFRHISTSGLGICASRASFVAVFAICCSRYRVSGPLRSRLTTSDALRRYFRFCQNRKWF